jgi:hypothetical protein
MSRVRIGQAPSSLLPGARLGNFGPGERSHSLPPARLVAQWAPESEPRYPVRSFPTMEKVSNGGSVTGNHTARSWGLPGSHSFLQGWAEPSCPAPPSSHPSFLLPPPTVLSFLCSFLQARPSVCGVASVPPPAGCCHCTKVLQPRLRQWGGPSPVGL